LHDGFLRSGDEAAGRLTFQVVIELCDLTDELVIAFHVHLIDRRLKEVITQSFLDVLFCLGDEDVPYFFEGEGHVAREDQQVFMTGARTVDETAIFTERPDDGDVDDDGQLGGDDTSKKSGVTIFVIHDVSSYSLA